MKTRWLVNFLIISIILIPSGDSRDIFGQTDAKLGASDENFKKIAAQGKIIHRGNDLLRAMQFEAAINKYTEATEAQYLITQNDVSFPYWLTIYVLQYQGKYSEAMQKLLWFQEGGGSKKDSFIDRKRKLEALIEWQKTGNRKQIYDYIEYVRKKYERWLPPKKMIAFSIDVFVDLIEIYDLVGDYDAGIALAKLFKRTTKDKRYKQEYDNIIKAFEESKQGLPKICGDEGRTCVGRATAYIIESDQI